MGILFAIVIMGIIVPFVSLAYGDIRPWKAANWNPKVKEFFDID
jgi:hypothetical protein